VSQFFYSLFSCGAALDLIAATAIWVVLRPRSSAARRSLMVVALFYLVLGIYAIPAAFADLLARPYHRFDVADVPPGRVALVVFGAGGERVGGWDDRVWIPTAIVTSRVLEAARVYRIAKPQWVISSGGDPDPSDRAEPSSTIMRRQLVDFGVPADRIVLESDSRDSHDEAVIIAPMLKSLGADSAILVTSAIHMRRSMGACRAAGWTPTPAVAPDPSADMEWSDRLIPSGNGVNFSSYVVHEVLGIGYYWTRGWYR
jgi:uncharacterized SAM-binding protein YcdF (DUF218 family)